MSTPPNFFGNMSQDNPYDSGYNYPTEGDHNGYPSYISEVGVGVYQSDNNILHDGQLDQGPYATDYPEEVEYASTTTGINSESTPTTQVSTRTTSTTGSTANSNSGEQPSGYNGPQLGGSTHLVPSPLSTVDPDIAEHESPGEITQIVAKKKGGRKGGKGKAPAPAPEQDPKRSKQLLRNRQAASKCRQKKKAFTADLEQKKQELEAEHISLQTQYNGLVGEKNRLREEVIGHAGCNDPRITTWINKTASNYAQQSSDEPSGGQSIMTDDAPHDRSPYAMSQTMGQSGSNVRPVRVKAGPSQHSGGLSIMTSHGDASAPYSMGHMMGEDGPAEEDMLFSPTTGGSGYGDASQMYGAG